MLFRHQPSMRCWTRRPVSGIDGRAEGGYIVWWPAAGEAVLCDAPPAPWPAWLLDELMPAPPEALTVNSPPPRCGSRYGSAALQHAADRVALAPIGGRNAALNSEAYSIGRLIAAGLLSGQEVADTLAAAAIAAGLTPREVEATLRSALAARGLL